MRRVLLPCAVAQAAALTILVAASDTHTAAPVLVTLAAVAGGSMPPVSACARMLGLGLRPTAPRGMRRMRWTRSRRRSCGPPAWRRRVRRPEAGAVSLVGTTLFATAPATGRIESSRGGGALGAVVQCQPLQILFMLGLPALAIHEGSHGAAGILLSLWSVSAAWRAAFSTGGRHWRSSSVRQLAMLLRGSAAVTLPLAVAWDLPSAFVMAGIAGVCGAPLFSRLYSLAGDPAPDTAAGTAFSWNTAALVAAVAGGSALAGVSVSDLGAHTPFLLSAVFGVVAAAMTAAAGGRLPVTAMCNRQTAPTCRSPVAGSGRGRRQGDETSVRRWLTTPAIRTQEVDCYLARQEFACVVGTVYRL